MLRCKPKNPLEHPASPEAMNRRPLLVAVVALGSSAAAPLLAQTADRALQERTVRRFWDLFNRAAWAELDELVTADIVTSHQASP